MVIIRPSTSCANYNVQAIFVVLGKLIGRYYDSSGKVTDYAKEVYKKIGLSKINKTAEKKENDRYPSCNVEYVKENQRSKVWCTTLRLVDI